MKFLPLAVFTALLSISAIAEETRGDPRQIDDIFKAVLTGDLALLKESVEAGADINSKRSPRGDTPLMAAAFLGQMEAARFLIKEGADVNAKNSKDGGSALHLAVFFCHLEMVDLLLQKGAKVNEQNDRGFPPLDPVVGDWSDELEKTYKSVANWSGIKMDLERIKKVRTEIAALLREKGGKTSKEL